MACSQHFAGIPGGRVGGQGMAPGGVGGQLALILMGGVLALQPRCREAVQAAYNKTTHFIHLAHFATRFIILIK